jgi:enoyl-CoA hydratase
MTALPSLTCLELSRPAEGVAQITLSRPKALNALNHALVGELGLLLDHLATEDLRALVITGAGQRAFAAGADIKEMVGFSPDEAEAMATRGQAVLRKLEQFPAPTIAAVRGFALGGGCELAMACDLVLASPSAVFGQPEVKLGVIPGFGGTWRLARRVGRQRALELMATGRNVPAEEAVRIGLALEIVDDDVVEAAVALGLRIARQGPAAVRLLRGVVDSFDAQVQERALADEARAFGQCFATADQTEGMTAFIEKRRPQFTGR